MYVLNEDDFTGRTGPARQAYQARPGIRHLSPALPASADTDATSPGSPSGLEINESPGNENTAPKRSHWTMILKAGLTAFRERAAERRRNRQIVLELSRLDDRTLRDIGLSRPEIEAPIERAVRGRR